MTTDLDHGTRIVHTDCTNCTHGIGRVVRTIGHTEVIVQWPGIPLARKEMRTRVERYVAPAATPTRRRQP